MCGRGACRYGGPQYRRAVQRTLLGGRNGAMPVSGSATGGGDAGKRTACDKVCEGAALGKAADKLSDVEALDVGSHVDIAFLSEDSFSPNYNIAPGQMFPVLCKRKHGLELVNARWGFLAPSCASGKYIINARSETVTEKPMFRKCTHRRGVMLVSGFYEWHKDGTKKQPYFIQMGGDTQSEQLMPLACIMSEEKNTSEVAFAVLTTHAPPEFAWCHDRVPVILPSATAIWEWLDDRPFDSYQKMFTPHRDLRWHKVHPMVGSIKNNGEQCIEVYAPKEQVGLTAWFGAKRKEVTPDETLKSHQSLVGAKLAATSADAPDETCVVVDDAPPACKQAVACPICGKAIPSNQAEEHVNRCLDAQQK
eukprot:TRINITY_DN27656_c0_g1_i1.p1 TRINITY_DN27656_c0_g1~~TRINITY_DN27656_c0_g1_i1.p1  ORF type:complete len:364 (-),score=33.08 TRINITY_DN27656_c0_g1_i1:439-1530(-)